MTLPYAAHVHPRARSIVVALMLALALVIALPARAQQATPTPTGPSNSLQAFFVACADQAILNFSGEMLVNFDVYYQVFAGAVGGTALTDVRRVPVSGTFAVSDQVAYFTGSTLPVGATGSARVFVARETDASRVDFEFVVTDVQDGCATPQNAPAGGINTGAAGGSDATGSTGTTVATGVQYGINRSILAPNGGVLNPNLSPEPAVVVGARTSDRFRSTTPGLIFAECAAYPLALPGIVYDTDTITVFWSWYARDNARMAEHLETASYNVTLNRAPLMPVVRSEPVAREGNVWVFYSATVGNLRPGHYEVGFDATWSREISDGYESFGPGTANVTVGGRCNFDVLLNPEGRTIFHNGMYFPTAFPVHNINTD